MKRAIVLFLLLVLFSQSFAQSIHQEQLKFYDKFKTSSPEFWQNYWHHKHLKTSLNDTCHLKKMVFGWHPYWSNGLEDNYQWNLLSDLAYFSYEVDYQTGKPIDTHNWYSAAVIDEAKKNGVRVHLTATLFSNFDSFFSNQDAQDTLINRLVEMVVNRGANGIDIDFEGMGNDNRDQFTAFIRNLKNKMMQSDTSLILSIALYSVDWNSVFDIPALNNYVDLFIIMGYDYYWSGSGEAGPTGQLYVLNSMNYTESRSIVYYLHQGVPPQKLLLGVPYYGRKWQTESGTVPSKTIDYVSVVTVKSFVNNYSNPKLNLASRSQYVVYSSSGNWYQVWVDMDSAMAYKFSVVNQTGIGGIGIWALGYDDGYLGMWRKIEEFFSTARRQVFDTLWDLGGPQRNYWNNEHYGFTLMSDSMILENADIELNYDTLKIYDGQGKDGTLLASITGAAGKQVFTSKTGYFYLEFYSDGATTKPGWTIVYKEKKVKGVDTVANQVLGVYPNPAQTTIKLNNITTGRFYVITNLYGTRVKSGFYNGPINVKQLPSGIYILTYFADRIYKFKFIKI